MATGAELGVALMIEQSITIGNIIEILVIAGGGISVFATMRTTVGAINTKVDEIQKEVKKLGDILIQQARIEERVTNLDRRVTLQDTLIDGLRRGEGRILPPN